MPKSKIIYQAKQEVCGKHLRSNTWVIYSGNLVIYDRQLNPILLKLKSEYRDSFVGEYMEDKKQFKGDSVTEVYGKLAKWFDKNDLKFRN